MPIIDPSALRTLHSRFKAAQDQFPRQLGFALARVRHDDWGAWDSLKLQGLGDTLASFNPRTRVVAFAGGADCPDTISVDTGERYRMKLPIEGWRCWLLRGGNVLDFPARAVDAWGSLSTDAARLLELKTSGTIFDGKLIDRKPGGYEHLLRWTVDQLPEDECPRRVWSDPAPGGYTPEQPLMLTRWEPGSPKRWKAEMSCVFSAVVRALEQCIRTLEVAPPPLFTAPPTPPTGTRETEGGKPPARRGGRPNLRASSNPKDKAKVNAYELIRVEKDRNPTWGKKELFTHFKNNKDFKQLVASAKLTFDVPMFHTALGWIKENPIVSS